jgi:aminoglycoside phosphotransferase (APT) family kinase protein
MEVRQGIDELIASLIPGARVVEVTPLGADAGASAGATGKAAGYGLPQVIRVALPDGSSRNFVLRTASANDFGHDRRADRSEGMILAFDTFGRIPRHVQAVDVGSVLPDGRLLSMRAGGETYLLTTWAQGRIYASDLRAIAERGTLYDADLARCDALAHYLLELHRPRAERPALYRRAIRDLVGHGEGIYGVVDGYPRNTPAAWPARLHAIERACAEWRWRLRGKEKRLVTTHGDFHPFNVVFDEGASFTLLDASRGGCGDRADDVTCMAVNYVFFALEHPSSWPHALGALWRRFWRTYLARCDDDELLAVCPPFFAWRALVVANPAFYPALPPAARDKLLRLAERGLEAGRFDPTWAEDLFT